MGSNLWILVILADFTAYILEKQDKDGDISYLIRAEHRSGKPFHLYTYRDTISKEFDTTDWDFHTEFKPLCLPDLIIEEDAVVVTQIPRLDEWAIEQILQRQLILQTVGKENTQ